MKANGTVQHAALELASVLLTGEGPHSDATSRIVQGHTTKQTRRGEGSQALAAGERATNGARRTSTGLTAGGVSGRSRGWVAGRMDGGTDRHRNTPSGQ